MTVSASPAADADRLLDARDAGARERERDLGRRRLEIVRELHAVRHAATVAACTGLTLPAVSAAGARAAGP